MKTFIFTVLLFLSFNVFSQNILTAKELTLEEHVLSLTTTFDVTSNGKIVGKIEADFISLTPSFKLYDNSKKLLAYASTDFISLSTTISIYNANKVKIGVIKHEVFEGLFSFENSYSISDGTNKRVATSKKLAMTSSIRLIENNVNTVYIYRDYSLFGDVWNIESNNTKVSNLILVFIPAFKTYYDGQKE